ISCEVCHAPLAAHAAAGEKIADMPIHRSITLCGWCHQRLDARPETFPQINFVEHVTDKGGGELIGQKDVCWECHEYAHDPIE
ncbi:MAG: hypothetical protein ACYSU2_05350, partial [Planctomycetota bacterium]